MSLCSLVLHGSDVQGAFGALSCSMIVINVVSRCSIAWIAGRVEDCRNASAMQCCRKIEDKS